MAQHSKKKSVYLGFFVFFLLIYVISSRGGIQNVDELTIFASMLNLMEKGTFSIDELSELDENIEYRIGFYGKDGHLYSKYSPGNVILGGLLYLVGDLVSPAIGRLLSLYLNAFLGSIGMLCLLAFIDQYFSIKTSLVTVLLIGLCSIWWYQSRGFGLETGGGTFLLISLLLADSGKSLGSATFFGISLYFRTLNLVAWPVWGLSILRIGRRAIRSALIILLCCLGLLAYNRIRFDSITNFGYDNVGFTTPLFVGLRGLLTSPGKSLILFSPVFLLAIPGAWKWFQIDKPLGSVLLLTTSIYIISNAAWVSWDSGWSWGPRLITPIVPLLGILIAPIIEDSWEREWIFLILIFLALWGFGMNLLSLSQDPITILRMAVMEYGIPYEDTVNTIENSHIMLQIKALTEWSPELIDSLILRSLINR